MAMSDWKNRLKQLFSPGPGDGTRRPDGGTSCYRPVKRRMEAEPVQTQMPGGDYVQPMQYVHTGFTGMTPPVSYAGDSPAYNQQPMYDQMAYGQTAYGQTAYGQPAYGQPSYGQPVSGQTAYMQQQDAYMQQSAGFFRTPAQPEEKTAARPERGWFAPRETKQPNNISYMPGIQPETGAPVTHVEHILTMTGLKTCYDAIECMKNGETLFVMLDAIANEGESMRCQDMLAGAAFTLGCSVRMLQGGRIVLIAPEGVKILPEQATRPDFQQIFTQIQPQTPQTQAPPPGAEPVKRERRQGSRAEEWQAARNGQMEQYNPYTGTMPVAAGAYGSFGGYGY